MTRFAVAERVLASLAAALFSLLALGGRPCHAGSTVTITDIQTWPAGVYHLEGLPIGSHPLYGLRSAGNGVRVTPECLLVSWSYEDTERTQMGYEAQVFSTEPFDCPLIYQSDSSTETSMTIDYLTCGKCARSWAR